MNITTQDPFPINRVHSQTRMIVSGSGFSILLPHLCGTPTASVSAFFHSIFKSKWAENVGSHVKGKYFNSGSACAFCVPQPRVQKPHHVFYVNPGAFIPLSPWGILQTTPRLILFSSRSSCSSHILRCLWACGAQGSGCTGAPGTVRV